LISDVNEVVVGLDVETLGTGLVPYLELFLLFDISSTFLEQL
jgi:hypothetical protein